MKEINEWFAEKCKIYITETYWAPEDRRSIGGEQWTIQDPRCLVIVCKKFGIDIIAGDTEKAINELKWIYEKEA